MSTYERPQWRRAALALLALSLLSGAAFSVLLGYERSRSAALREQVRRAEHIRDLAVEELCCGQWADGLTAAGLLASPGIIAVDPEIIPLGATVIIDGQRYLAADTGVTGQAVDLCMESHAAALAFGRSRQSVWIEVPGHD